MFAGQLIEGACVSLTVTVNMQLPVLPDASVAVHVTVVVPFENVEPDAGEHVGVPTPGQLSLAVAFVYVTAAVHTFGAVDLVTLAGHVTVGACVSLTVTVNEQVLELPDASLTLQLTVVVPFGNVE